MSDYEEILSDEEVEHTSSHSFEATIENSNEESEEEDIEPITRPRRTLKKRIAAIDSETSTSDEEDAEQLALSPRTRMSITGIRPSDLTDDDSSEIEYSQKATENIDDHDVRVISTKLLGSSGELNEYNMVDMSIQSFVEDSAIEASIDVTKTIEDAVKRPSLFNDGGDSPINVPRYSTKFENDIKEQLSSTIQSDHPNKWPNSDSDSIEIITNRETTIEIFSSNDEGENDTKYSNDLKDKATVGAEVISATALKQPKITTAVVVSAKLPDEKTQCVSQDYYNKETKKLEDLKQELFSAEKIFEKISKNLPDSGRQLKMRIERLHNDVKNQTKRLSTLKIEDGIALQQRKPLFNRDAPNWNELSEAVNQIQPAHMGKQGLATFNNQKALTVECLKDLHGSLENCPPEGQLAENPAGLKINLMNHQKYALIWLNWREKQKPPGGILADDMGLGKTLTMISLVLAAKNREEERKGSDHPENDSDDDERENKGEWSSKGRKDYYKGGTLVVCPASLLRQWESEALTKVRRHKLTVCVHHGNNRDTKPKHLRTYDMVITTYNLVSREHKTHGALFGLKWHRIILDEAHVIRNHKAQSSIAACELRGKYRWALTGTPIQNKEMDLYALMKYLRCTPFDDLGHWKRWIDNKNAGGQHRLNMVIKSLMLRRTKIQLQDQGELECLPEKRTELIEVELDKDEMNVYQKIITYSRTLLAQFISQRVERSTDLMYREQANRLTSMQTKHPNDAFQKVHQQYVKLNHGNKEIKSHEILLLLLRLRQICCHPGLIDAMLEDDDTQKIDSETDQSQPEIDLLEQLNKLVITNESKDSGSSDIPSGQADLVKSSAKVLQRSNPVFDFDRPSSKLLKVMEILKKFVLQTNDKAIVVSQWTSVLEILKSYLAKERVSTLSLNGSIPVKNRQDIISEFNNAASDKKVLLLSLTAGGVGLNLIGANHLFLIDLHWNPQLEAQAQDRIYRVGQKKNVVIYKFMCKNTVEERIRALQEQKLAMANCLLTGTKAGEGSKLTLEDIKSLFGM